MKLQNILGLLLLSVLTLSSCSDDDDYVWGGKTNENGYNVYFSQYNSTSLAIGMDDTEMEIVVERDITANSDELTVPIRHNVIDEGVFKVPSTVTFAAGEAEATLVVEISDKLPLFTERMLSLSIPEEYTYQYAQQNVAPVFLMNVVKEDYKVVANGVYSAWFFGSWEQPLEYSEILGIYRFPDVIVPGVHFYMFWEVAEDGTQTCYFTDSKGNKVDSFTTGYIHSMGEIYADPLYDYEMGMLDQDVFYFPFYISIPSANAAAGSNYDTYTVTEWLTE